MKNTKLGRFGKTLVAICLSFSIAFAGQIVMPTQTAEAAYSSSKASSIISTGKRYLGVRYQFGAPSGSTSSFDCSSFVQYVYKRNGIYLPRSSRQQAQSGYFVRRSNLRPGDLAFFDTNNDGRINHVAIYMGNDRLLHTYKVGIGVTITKFSGTFWSRHYKTGRRVM